jgi:hypothetical protein
MGEIARLSHAPPLPKHGAVPRNAKRLEASEQTGMDFALSRHADSHFTPQG